ncbi:hypothetical protein LCS82_09380 [Vibrio harveyi]|uniref:hypothetical protein n=1 Tax=Vibrio harveyi TaxID=669 RepID=UPI003BB6536F
MTNEMAVFIQQIRTLRKAGVSTIFAPRNLSHNEKLIWIAKATVAVCDQNSSVHNDEWANSDREPFKHIYGYIEKHEALPANYYELVNGGFPVPAEHRDQVCCILQNATVLYAEVGGMTRELSGRRIDNII